MGAPAAGKALLLVKLLRTMSTPMRGIWLPERRAAKCDFCQCRGGDCHHPMAHAVNLLLQGWRFTSIPPSPGERQQGIYLQHGTAASLGNPSWEDLAALLHFCYWDSNHDCAWKGWDFVFPFLLIVPPLFLFQKGIWIRTRPSPTANRHRKWNHKFSTSK